MQESVSEFLKPRVVKVAPVNSLHAKVTIEPFERGYGHTLGNALRRILLGAVEGAAITSVVIKGVNNEFSSLPGVRFSVIAVLYYPFSVQIARPSNSAQITPARRSIPVSISASDGSEKFSLIVPVPELSAKKDAPGT